MDSSPHLISGRPFGVIGIFFNKSPYSTKIIYNSKRVCDILITMHNNYTCMLLSIYIPVNNYAMLEQSPAIHSIALSC